MADPPASPAVLPILFTVAIDAALLLHTPPVLVSLNVTDVPWQKTDVPETGPTVGGFFTVTTSLAVVVPQAPVVE